MLRQSMISAVALASLLVMGGGMAGRGPAARDNPAAPPPPSESSVSEAIATCLDPAATIKAGESRTAEKIVQACAAAIQSRKLTPAEIAQARLNRGAARTVLGDRILASGDYLAALKHYDSAIDPMNPDALQLYRTAAALDGVGKIDAALGKYGEAIKADPKLALAYYGRGILLATRERAYTRAIGDFDKTIALEPANIAALVRRGEAYSQLGDFGHAISDLNRALQLDPANPTAYVVRGLVNDRRGEPALAAQDFDAALKLNRREANALRNRGVLRARLGQLDEALLDFDAVIALHPHDPLAFFNRGYVLFGKRQYDLAVVDYGTAITLDPTMGPAYLNRCLTLTVQGRDLVKALADCDQALKLMPLSIDVRETRGFIYLKLGDPAIAIAEYGAALQINANRPLALYGQGVAKIRMGRKDEGEADQAAALVLNPAVTREFELYGVE